MGLFSLIGGLFGGHSEKKAARQASAAQIEAYNHGIDIQNRQYQQDRTDFAPYLAAGTNGLQQYGDLEGANGADVQAQAIQALQGSPIYQSLYDNGQNTLLQNAAATGGLRGGNTQQALAGFGRDTLAQVYQNALGNSAALANMGLGATGQVANYGAHNADAVTGLYGDIGSSKASKDLTVGGINAQNWNNVGSFLDSAVSAFLPGGGGGVGGALKSIF